MTGSITMVASAGRIDATETIIVSLLLIAAVVAIAASFLKIPYSVALVVVGLLLGLAGVYSDVKLSEQLIVLVFLPPLVFEGAINLHLDELRHRWLQVGLLAVFGTLLSAAAIASALVIIPGMPLPAASLIAVMLAPTDPVSVLAIFKANGVQAGLQTILEGESLFNDALGIVLYVIATDVAFPQRHSVTAIGGGLEFIQEIAVGVIVGLLVGFVAHRLMRTLRDRLIEITLSLITAYGAFLIADRIGGSGIIATVVAGLLIGNYGTERSMTRESHQALLGFWEVLAFLANSGLFLLIGLAFRPHDLLQTRTLVSVAVVAITMMGSRAVAVWALLVPFSTSRVAAVRRVPKPWISAVFWGGLRGGIPVALVLGLEGRAVGNTNTEALVFGVVLLSLICQGLTYTALLRRLGLLIDNTSD